MIIQNIKVPRAIVLVTDKSSTDALKGMEHFHGKNISIVNAEMHFSTNVLGRVKLSYIALKHIWFPFKPSGTDK